MTSTPEVLVFARKKGVNLIFFSKHKYLYFLFTVTHHNISQLTQKYTNYSFFIMFMEEMQISLFSEKFKLLLILQKNWNSVSLYLKKLPILYGIKIKIFF